MSRLQDGWIQHLRKTSRELEERGDILERSSPKTSRKRPVHPADIHDEDCPNAYGENPPQPVPTEPAGGQKKIRSPPSSDIQQRGSSPTASTPGRSRARPPLDDFDRSPYRRPSSNRRLFDPESDPLRSKAAYNNSPREKERLQRSPRPIPAEVSQPFPIPVHHDHPHHDLVPQLETRAISHEQLVAEVKGIYTGLVMIESKCIEVDTVESRNTATRLSGEQWQALIALHRTLPHEHNDFFASQAKVANKGSEFVSNGDRMAPRKGSASKLQENPGKFEYFVDGEANGLGVEAFPDTGANESFISSELALKLGLTPLKDTQRQIKLPTNTSVVSPGCVELTWSFTDQTPYLLKCFVVPGCLHDLILGAPFLRLSNILKKLRQRVKRRIRSCTQRRQVNLLGSEQQRLWGVLNGQSVAALPDTGSDLMLISENAAAELGLLVDRDPEQSLEVEFADGTRAWTSGCIHDASWSVGDHAVLSDFHVLPNLRVDVVLSNDYLFESNAFSEFEGFFSDCRSIVDVHLCNIRYIGSYSEQLNLAEQDWEADLRSPDPFSPTMVQKEDARRDDIQTHILKLAPEKQQNAQQDEMRRQKRWEYEKQKHRESQNQKTLQTSGEPPRPTMQTLTASSSASSSRREVDKPQSPCKSPKSIWKRNLLRRSRQLPSGNT